MAKVFHLTCIHSGSTTSFLHICGYSALDVFSKAIGQRMIGRVHGWIAETIGKLMVAAGSEKSLPNRLINLEEYNVNLTDSVAVQVENNMNSHSNSNTNK